MKKYFFTIILLFSFTTNKLNAQNDKQHIADLPIKRTLIRDLHTEPITIDFKGAVVFNDRLLTKGLTSIAFFPVDTLKTFTYVQPLAVTKSLIDIDPACQFGILVLNTSSAESGILRQSASLSLLEQILLNSKQMLYKNESQEPE